MRVAIVGAGAMGSVFGGLLTVAGNDVWLVDPWAAHVEEMRRRGLRLEGIGGERVVAVQATGDAGRVGQVDLVIVFVKSTETGWAAQAAQPLTGPDTTVLTLQNGLGNREILAAALGEEKVICGITFAGAQLLGPGHARFTSDAETRLGEVGGGLTPRLSRTARALSAAGLPTRVCEDVMGEVWGKLLVNCVCNATCALTAYTVSGLMDHACSREMVRLVAEETAAVAQALGIRLPYPDPLERMRQNCEKSGPAKPSLLQDIEKQRWTEIDFINGAVVRAGERAGVPTPYNRALTLLVKMIEARQHGSERLSACG